MNLLARFLRSGAKLRFKVLRLATIKDLPTEQFDALLESLLNSGWQKTYVYDGFDAWIDYGQIKLKKGGTKLKFEWDNYTEGSLEGPASTIEEIGKLHDLKVIYQWRWSDYD